MTYKNFKILSHIFWLHQLQLMSTRNKENLKKVANFVGVEWTIFFAILMNEVLGVLQVAKVLYLLFRYFLTVLHVSN